MKDVASMYPYLFPKKDINIKTLKKAINYVYGKKLLMLKEENTNE